MTTPVQAARRRFCIGAVLRIDGYLQLGRASRKREILEGYETKAGTEPAQPEGGNAEGQEVEPEQREPETFTVKAKIGSDWQSLNAGTLDKAEAEKVAKELQRQGIRVKVEPT